MPLHCRKPVGSCLVGAIAGRVDACRVNLYWNVYHWVSLGALGGVLVALAAAVPIVLLLLEVELSNDTLELREVGGVCRAIGQVLLEQLVESRVVELAQGPVVISLLLLILLEAQAVLCGSAFSLADFAQLCMRQLLHADN
jgi:hypothetical protein